MTDDYLLQEFHEAGIWLPGEKEVIRLQAHITRGEMILQRNPTFGGLGQQRQGPPHPTDLFDVLGKVGSGIFGRGLR